MRLGSRGVLLVERGKSGARKNHIKRRCRLHEHVNGSIPANVEVRACVDVNDLDRGIAFCGPGTRAKAKPPIPQRLGGDGG